MVKAAVSDSTVLVGSEEFALVGLNDLAIVNTQTGPMLFATTRGDGWLTAFDVGEGGTDTTLSSHWRIGPEFLQLETTDLVLRSTASGDQLFKVGLASDALTGVSLGGGSSLSQISFASPDISAGTLTEMALFPDHDVGLAAVRGGGLVNVSFTSVNTMNAFAVPQSGPLSDARATGIATATDQGQNYAFVTYQSEDAVALFRQSESGQIVEINSVFASDGFWSDTPTGLTTLHAVDDALYVVVASAGSDSLTSLKVTPDGLIPVDHVMDTTATRFAGASHVTSVALGDHDFVLTAGADSGISLFTVMAGGRLQHITDMVGTAEIPLRGITALEAAPTDTGIRIWVSTQSAPFLAEFTIDLPDLGTNQSADRTGSVMTGTASDDTLNGASGNDRIAGQAGDDLLMDGAGQDTLIGGAGADTFILTPDDTRDTIEDFQINEDRLDLSAYGTLGGVGGITINSRTGGAEIRIGDDVLDVRSSNGQSLSAAHFDTNTLITGNRIQTDPANYPDSTATPRPDPNPGQTTNPDPTDPTLLAPQWVNAPSFSLAPQSGSTHGTSGADVLQVNASGLPVFGAGGNDTITGSTAPNRISGDTGNDNIQGGNNNDLLLGSAGFDTITGGNGNDTLDGGTFADSLMGEDGNDVILGGDGFDNIYGGQGADSVWAGAAPDRIYGGDGDDWLSAGSNVGLGVDGVFGEGGNDTLFGNAGFDLLSGGDGDDLLDGGHQADNLYGDAGNDTLIGNLGFDRLFGGEGDDKLSGGASGDGLFGQGGNDTIWGDEGDDRFFGGQGNDILDGGMGADIMNAGAGFDTLIGGAGDDQLFGNFNADEFIFAPGHGNDTLGDFDALNPLEQINLSPFGTFSSFQQIQSLALQSGQDVLINTSADSSLLLRNVDLDDLDETDFVF